MRDTQAVWHPCTQMKDTETYPIISIERGQGVYLYDTAGKAYLDAVSSWWVNLFGHANPRIAAAVSAQITKLEHVIFAGFTHEPAEALTERLLELTPPDLKHVFFADNGSSGVEAALKMSFGYWKNLGRPEKNRFVYLTNGYHGETLGALSLCGDALYADLYREIMLPQIEVRGPDCYRCPYGEQRETCDVPCFAAMQETLFARKDEIAGVIVEPLVQCAGGFRMYPPKYLARLRQATREAETHLILDEIAVGFGRAGTMFAAEQADVCADILCLSKGITSGTMTLCVVLATEEIYRAFYADYGEMKAFLHSHSYSGNPLACAAALATLDIFRDDDVLAANVPKSEFMQQAVRKRFEGLPYVGEVRSTGFICAVELVEDRETKRPFDWRRRLGFQIYREALSRGVLLRNLGEVVYFMPPYVITQEEIEKMADVALKSVRAVLK